MTREEWQEKEINRILHGEQKRVDPEISWDEASEWVYDVITKKFIPDFYDVAVWVKICDAVKIAKYVEGKDIMVIDSKTKHVSNFDDLCEDDET